MTDIVNRLRGYDPEKLYETPIEMNELCTEAADEIERLRAALRELLDDCVEYARINNLSGSDGKPATNHAMRMARAALGEAKDE